MAAGFWDCRGLARDGRAKGFVIYCFRRGRAQTRRSRTMRKKARTNDETARDCAISSGCAEQFLLLRAGERAFARAGLCGGHAVFLRAQGEALRFVRRMRRKNGAAKAPSGPVPRAAGGQWGRVWLFLSGRRYGGGAQPSRGGKGLALAGSICGFFDGRRRPFLAAHTEGGG